MIIAKAPGSCGEYLQGIFWGNPGIISAPINMYSTAILTKGTGQHKLLPKAEMAYKKFFEKYNIDPKLGEEIDITIETELPLEKGMASSTADILAVVYALAAYFKIDIEYWDAFDIAISIEPSDNTMFPNLDVINHYTGEFLYENYMILRAPVLILDFDLKVNTIDFGYATEFQKSEDLSELALSLFEEGLLDDDLIRIGQATTLSALNNQTALEHPFFYQVKKLSSKHKGCGLILGHSGSVIGILYDESFRKEEFIEEVQKELGEHLEGIYDKKLIPGGVDVIELIEDPKEIEKRSFEIIDSRIKSNKPGEDISDIVYRVIHTTADLEMNDLLEFKNNPVESGLKALKKGRKIYADTNMIREGVNKRALEMTGSEVITKVHDPEVIEEAQEKGKTRSSIAIEKALEDPEIGIFAIGNAPTALYTLIERIRETGNKPDLIIGVPVGFVGASEAKEALNYLNDLEVPYIRINGEKGGSTVAVAILNALLYRLGREW